MASPIFQHRKREIKTVLVKRLLEKKKKYSKNAYICALIHCTVKRVIGSRKNSSCRNASDADHNFHSMERNNVEDSGERSLNL